METTSKVTNIIIVNYNCWQYTIACLKTLLQSSNQNFKVFIIDNNSKDNSLQKIKNYCVSQKLTFAEYSSSPSSVTNSIKSDSCLIKLIVSKENSGFASGNNIVLKNLIREVNNEFVWLLNPDTEVEPRVHQELLALAQTHKKTIVGNAIFHFEDPTKIIYYGGFKVKKMTHGIIEIKSSKNINDIDAITGACLFTHIDTFKELGGLPEKYFMYWEETDFCTNAYQNGYRFLVNDKSKVLDHVGVTSKSNFLREYLYVANGLIFYKKYYLKNFLFVLLSTFGKLLKAGLFENKIKFKAILYAHVDFARILLNNPNAIKQRLKKYEA
jgi:GT2 family glycosyltransferase